MPVDPADRDFFRAAVEARERTLAGEDARIAARTISRRYLLIYRWPITWSRKLISTTTVRVAGEPSKSGWPGDGQHVRQ